MEWQAAWNLIITSNSWEYSKFKKQVEKSRQAQETEVIYLLCYPVPGTVLNISDETQYLELVVVYWH